MQRCLGVGSLGRLLGQKDGVDVGQNSSLGDGGSSKQAVQLLIVPDGQLEMTRNDPPLLVVPGSVPSQLDDLGSKVLHDSSQVDGSSSTNTASVVSLPEKTVDPSNRELETSSDSPGYLL